MTYSEKCLELAKSFINKSNELEAAKSENSLLSDDLKRLSLELDEARNEYFDFLAKYSNIGLDDELEK